MELDEILRSLESGSTTIEETKRLLSLHSIETVGDMARLDVGRAHRRGIPEVLFAESKQLSDIRSIMRAHPETDPLVVSRLRRDHYHEAVEFARGLGMRVETGRGCTTILAYRDEPVRCGGVVGVLTAGTSDIPVGEEVRLMCAAMGCATICRYDVGVAGLHRTLPVLGEMVRGDVDCAVVAAGMEGALATIAASMLSVPVIGLPVSVGYGYGAGGMAALGSMLQSCALGLTVVNIDGGIAAGAAAASIARSARRRVRDGRRPPG